MFYVYTHERGWLCAGNEWSDSLSGAEEFPNEKTAQLAGENATSLTLHIFELMPS